MSGSLGTSPTDTDVATVASESLSAISNVPNSSSTAPSSVTSEPPTSIDSPSLKALDDVFTPKLRVDSSTASIIANVAANSHAKRAGTADKPLASREPVASVPSDFPGKKVHFAVTIPAGGNFESDKHFYARCLNAQIHPSVASFFNLGRQRIILRYCHLHPAVSEEFLGEILNYRPKHFHWAGSDLFTVTNAHGTRQSIIIETNSCPSGQKSMPLLQDTDEYGGYRKVIDQFVRAQAAVPKEWGGLAVIWDKNEMEATGYAAVMADLCAEQIYLAEYRDNDQDPPVKWVNGIMHVRVKETKQWHPIRAAFRYVTNAPWKRIPIRTKTLVMNKIVACLAGGRNKMMAHRAYELFNAELVGTGLAIRTPETYTNVPKPDIPLRVAMWGGHAVLKVPYSNAGQGVYTITNPGELEAFMAMDHHYDKFLVQSLVGNASWSSIGREGLQYHIGNIPDKRGRTYVSDLRVMVIASDAEGKEGGFSPVAIYARRARKPLVRDLVGGAESSWDMLGTNLSVKLEDGSYTTDTNRLLLMDRKDFNSLGISIDDLIESYISTVLSVIAIDKMACRLVDEKGQFDMELFSALNPDDVLCGEILM